MITVSCNRDNDRDMPGCSEITEGRDQAQGDVKDGGILSYLKEKIENGSDEGGKGHSEREFSMGNAIERRELMENYKYLGVAGSVGK